MRRATFLLLLVALTACADESSRWAKPGVGAATVSTDVDRCERQAREATRREDQINADILASRGNDWQRTGTLSAKEADMAASSRSQGNRALAACMAAKGYSPVR
ncbi:MAG: hypothetical protein JWL84_4142 [Rhodospirillales bacterium]|jgi:hypothetical protein|nr:hypothetical protein [Rhodospirillales bacterium]